MRGFTLKKAPSRRARVSWSDVPENQWMMHALPAASASAPARAFGIDAVLVTPSCHDPLFRRASRTSQGTVLQVPWTRIGTQRQWAAEGIPLLHAAGFKVAALALEDRSLALGDPRLAAFERLAMVLGTDAAGLFPSTISAGDETV